ncbi:MAG: [FeFe] hydrogenase H-cluster radical SAM maturase HydE [Thermoanaerobacteraceae bacterium]|nr:[FeFe] hydrogenase H-cluster radical SAM maturase HydE [Thermoanaerobacteraceae bacterium]
MRAEYNDLLKKAINDGEFTREEVIFLLKPEDDEKDVLFHTADVIRKEVFGDEVHLRGIIEFSNYCERNCLYCGLRRDNKNLTRYRLMPEEIIDIAVNAERIGYRTIVLQSGEDSFYTTEILCQVVRDIKDRADVAITLSIGERGFEDYRLLKEAGADRYLIKQETSSPELYRKLHPDMRYENRIRCQKDLKTLGYELGTGNMVGLPWQTVEELADDILFFREIDADMIGIGPFISNPHTPLRNFSSGMVEDTLKVLAVTRLINPLANLPATTALGSLDSYGRQKGLTAGANVVMPNVTTMKYRRFYEIYPSKICTGERPEACRHCIEGIIESIGRRVSSGYGESPKSLRGGKERCIMK